jgi:hypothetical protein
MQLKQEQALPNMICHCKVILKVYTENLHVTLLQMSYK